MDNETVSAPEFPELAEFVGDYSNLADARLGAEVIAVSDEFFAVASRMLDPSPPVWKRTPSTTTVGGWMAGSHAENARRGMTGQS